MLKRNSIINLALFFNDPLESGGGFQQSLSILLDFKKFDYPNVNFIAFTTRKDIFLFLRDNSFKCELINFGILIKIFLDFYCYCYNNKYLNYLFKFLPFKNIFENKFKEHNIDLIYFLSPSFYIKYIHELNFISTVWDLAHIDNNEFIEVRDKFIFKQRESYYFEDVRRSTYIVCESNYTINALNNTYGIPINKCFVVPLGLTKQFENISNKNISLKKFKIYKPFIFYPAQYWQHKNHIYLIKALKLLLSKYKLELNLVFCGSDKGNLKFLKDFVSRENLQKHVIFLNFVSSNELSYLYSNCEVLGMPTYFGPTNLPPLEAFFHRKPVIYSNLNFLKEQFKDSVCYCNLSDPDSFAKIFIKIQTNRTFKTKLINKGINYLLKSQNFNNKFIYKQMFNKFISKKNTWST